MPISLGYIEGNAVIVLRDTGCSGIVVRWSKVRDESLTGSSQSCIVAACTTVRSHVAKINIDTPYFQGTVEAWCMESPVYDLIVGNISNTRQPGNPDQQWNQVTAVET